MMKIRVKDSRRAPKIVFFFLFLFFCFFFLTVSQFASNSSKRPEIQTSLAFRSKLTFRLKNPGTIAQKETLCGDDNVRASGRRGGNANGSKSKMSTKSGENVERSARFLIKAKIQYLFRVSWDAPLRLLSSHSSVLMLNFQNFYITKGPTTSAEKYPASTKSVSQPRPCRGETLAFRPLSAVNRERAKGDFSATFRPFQDFSTFLPPFDRRRQRRGKTGLLWRKHDVNDLPRTRPRCRGWLIYSLYYFTKLDRFFFF